MLFNVALFFHENLNVNFIPLHPLNKKSQELKWLGILDLIQSLWKSVKKQTNIDFTIFWTRLLVTHLSSKTSFVDNLLEDEGIEFSITA